MKFGREKYLNRKYDIIFPKAYYKYSHNCKICVFKTII